MENGLSIDVNKCELIHFTRQRKDLNNLPLISIPNETGENMKTNNPTITTHQMARYNV
jgi:hypothetical protein